MEIADLLKKQQLNKLKKDSAKNQNAKDVNDKKTSSSLTERRKQLHMSIPQLSMLTGIDQVKLTRWETDGMTPDDSISEIHKYAKVMHLDLQKLVSNILDSNPD